MTKIKHTITINTGVDTRLIKTLVTDAELVLVECANIDGMIFKHIYAGEKGYHNNYLTKDQIDHQSIFNYKGYKPILISRTERIEVGDWVWDKLTNEIFQIPDLEVYKEATTFLSVFKILALPEHFSSAQLQDIVDGKLKEGKCLVECESFRDLGVIAGDRGTVSHIKLNPHITIYPVEEKMYTREEVYKILEQYELCAIYAGADSTFLVILEEWFEQNVK